MSSPPKLLTPNTTTTTTTTTTRVKAPKDKISHACQVITLCSIKLENEKTSSSSQSQHLRSQKVKIRQQLIPPPSSVRQRAAGGKKRMTRRRFATPMTLTPRAPSLSVGSSALNPAGRMEEAADWWMILIGRRARISPETQSN